MRCDELTQWMSDSIDGRLDEEQERTLREHVAGCECCRAEYDTLEQTVSLLRDVEQVEPPVDLVARVRERMQKPASEPVWLVFNRPQWRAALAACFLVVVCFYGIRHMQGDARSRSARGAERVLVAAPAGNTLEAAKTTVRTEQVDTDADLGMVALGDDRSGSAAPASSGLEDSIPAAVRAPRPEAPMVRAPAPERKDALRAVADARFEEAAPAATPALDDSLRGVSPVAGPAQEARPVEAEEEGRIWTGPRPTVQKGLREGGEEEAHETIGPVVAAAEAARPDPIQPSLLKSRERLTLARRSEATERAIVPPAAPGPRSKAMAPGEPQPLLGGRASVEQVLHVAMVGVGEQDVLDALALSTRRRERQQSVLGTISRALRSDLAQAEQAAPADEASAAADTTAPRLVRRPDGGAVITASIPVADYGAVLERLRRLGPVRAGGFPEEDKKKGAVGGDREADDVAMPPATGSIVLRITLLPE